MIQNIKHCIKHFKWNETDSTRLEISNLSTTFSKSIMKNKIWVFFYGTWEQEFSARRKKHTSSTYHAKTFWSWLCRTIQGIWNHQKIKKLEWEKMFFLIFCPIYASDAWNMFWENWDTHARKQFELKCKALSLKCLKKKQKI